MAEPLLFHNVTIYPHMHRLEQVLNVCLQPRLRQHVKSICYDNRYIGLVDFIIKKIESTFSARVSADDKAAMISKAWEFKKPTLEPRRDEDIELLFLHDILRNLPNLESISCIENRMYGMGDDVIDINDLPDLYAQLRRRTCGSHADYDLELGHYTFPKLKQTAARILVASARSTSTRVTSLVIENGIWESITNFEPGGKHIGLLTPLLSNLRTLEISADSEDEMRYAFLMNNLSSVLDLAVALRTLHLDFGSRANDPHTVTTFDPGEPTSGLVSSLACVAGLNRSAQEPAVWPRRLCSLSLAHVFCLRSDLKWLLRQCEHTLKHFSLSSLAIVPRPTEKPYPERKSACLINIMHDLHKYLNLESIKLSGRFTNTRAQTFDFRDPCDECKDEPTLTKNKLQDFILKGGKCPIDHLAIRSGELDIDENQLEEAECLGDESFMAQKTFFAAQKLAELEAQSSALAEPDIEHESDEDSTMDDSDEDEVAPWDEPEMFLCRYESVEAKSKQLMLGWNL